MLNFVFVLEASKMTIDILIIAHTVGYFQLLSFTTACDQ